MILKPEIFAWKSEFKFRRGWEQQTCQTHCSRNWAELSNRCWWRDQLWAQHWEGGSKWWRVWVLRQDLYILYSIYICFKGDTAAASKMMAQCLLRQGCFLGMLPSISERAGGLNSPQPCFHKCNPQTLPAISLFLRGFPSLQLSPCFPN